MLEQKLFLLVLAVHPVSAIPILWMEARSLSRSEFDEMLANRTDIMLCQRLSADLQLYKAIVSSVCLIVPVITVQRFCILLHAVRYSFVHILSFCIPRLYQKKKKNH